MKGKSLEGSAHTPMYNPHRLPLMQKVELAKKFNPRGFLERIPDTDFLNFIE